MFSETKNNILLIDMENLTNVESVVLQTLKPLIENWSNVKLSNDLVIWGIRRYLDGASLAFHVDRLPTHVLSAVLQVMYIFYTKHSCLFLF